MVKITQRYHLTKNNVVKRNPLTKAEKAFLSAVKYGTMQHHGEHTAQVNPGIVTWVDDKGNHRWRHTSTKGAIYGK